MNVLHLLALLGEAQAERHDDNNALGYVIIVGFIAVIVLLAYMLGKRNPPPPATQLLCPRCQAVRRGKFCSVCGTKF